MLLGTPPSICSERYTSTEERFILTSNEVDVLDTVLEFRLSGAGAAGPVTLEKQEAEQEAEHQSGELPLQGRGQRGGHGGGGH